MSIDNKPHLNVGLHFASAAEVECVGAQVVPPEDGHHQINALHLGPVALYFRNVATIEAFAAKVGELLERARETEVTTAEVQRVSALQVAHA